jgi:hypothetical protein
MERIEQTPQEPGLPNLDQVAADISERANALAGEKFQNSYADNLLGAASELLDPGKNRFSRAQDKLELADWVDETRWLAVEINRVDQEANDVPALSLDEAIAKVNE